MNVTKEKIEDSILMLATNYNKEHTADQLKSLYTLWYMLFSEIEECLFEKAVLNIIENNRYFPNVADVFEAIANLTHKTLNADMEFKKLLSVTKKYNPYPLEGYDTNGNWVVGVSFDENQMMLHLSPHNQVALRRLGVAKINDISNRTWTLKEYKEIIQEANEHYTTPSKLIENLGSKREELNAQDSNRRIG